jgi:hypothetical protein
LLRIKPYPRQLGFPYQLTSHLFHFLKFTINAVNSKHIIQPDQSIKSRNGGFASVRYIKSNHLNTEMLTQLYILEWLIRNGIMPKYKESLRNNIRDGSRKGGLIRELSKHGLEERKVLMETDSVRVGGGG